MEAGEALKRFRQSLNLSQSKMAKKLGMLPQAYFRYEKGFYLLPTAALMKLAKEYGVSTDYLLGLSDNPRPPEIATLVAAINGAQEILGNALGGRTA